MKKLLISLMLIAAGLAAQAKVPNINSAVNDCGIKKDSISISIKNTDGLTLYSLNELKPISPASTQKVVTATVSLDTLGEDYNFTTSLYKTSNNELQLKLGADPLFTRYSLNKLLKTAAEKGVTEPKTVYIDDFIMDSVEWGEGWQWDDDLNPLMPKFSSYNIDRNLLYLTIDPTKKGAPAALKLSTFYPVTFMNLTTTGNGNSLKISRNNNISPDIITLSGEIKVRDWKIFPVNNPRRYFLIKLDEAISDAKIEYFGKYPQRKTPQKGLTLIAETKHPLGAILQDVFKNSNNMAAETLFKVAGGKFVNNTGALKNSLKMFDEYCQKKDLNSEDIRIVDGSGVSKNNLMTADFMTDFLVLQSQRDDFEDYMKLFPTAGEGTLKDRMLYFKDIIYVKTGTLSNISALCGYVKTRNGNIVAFDIMINDAKSSASDKKAAEEQIVRAIYNQY